jgi:hypothetical protein
LTVFSSTSDYHASRASLGSSGSFLSSTLFP